MLFYAVKGLETVIDEGWWCRVLLTAWMDGMDSMWLME